MNAPITRPSPDPPRIHTESTVRNIGSFSLRISGRKEFKFRYRWDCRGLFVSGRTADQSRDAGMPSYALRLRVRSLLSFWVCYLHRRVRDLGATGVPTRPAVRGRQDHLPELNMPDRIYRVEQLKEYVSRAWASTTTCNAVPDCSGSPTHKIWISSEAQDLPPGLYASREAGRKRARSHDREAKAGVNTFGARPN
jgi:hypothetical protein